MSYTPLILDAYTFGQIFKKYSVTSPYNESYIPQSWVSYRGRIKDVKLEM
jgi:hypothetical protein